MINLADAIIRYFERWRAAGFTDREIELFHTDMNLEQVLQNARVESAVAHTEIPDDLSRLDQPSDSEGDLERRRREFLELAEANTREFMESPEYREMAEADLAEYRESQIGEIPSSFSEKDNDAFRDILNEIHHTPDEVLEQVIEPILEIAPLDDEYMVDSHRRIFKLVDRIIDDDDLVAS